EPAVLRIVPATRPVDARRLPRVAARERSRRLRAPVSRDRTCREPRPPSRGGRAPDPRHRRVRRQPDAARARPRARARDPAGAARRALRRRAHDPARGARRSGPRDRGVLARRRRRRCNRSPRRHDAAAPAGGSVRPSRRSRGRRRGPQIVGSARVYRYPGDICFIPRNTPHRITVTSDDEELVILWAFGGAATIEDAGYVPLPDNATNVKEEPE